MIECCMLERSAWEERFCCGSKWAGSRNGSRNRGRHQYRTGSRERGTTTTDAKAKEASHRWDRFHVPRIDRSGVGRVAGILTTGVEPASSILPSAQSRLEGRCLPSPGLSRSSSPARGARLSLACAPVGEERASATWTVGTRFAARRAVPVNIAGEAATRAFEVASLALPFDGLAAEYTVRARRLGV